MIVHKRAKPMLHACAMLLLAMLLSIRRERHKAQACMSFMWHWHDHRGTREHVLRCVRLVDYTCKEGVVGM